MRDVLELAETFDYSYRTLFDGIDLVRAAAAAARRVRTIILTPATTDPLPPSPISTGGILVLRVDASG